MTFHGAVACHQANGLVLLLKLDLLWHGAAIPFMTTLD
jgi:hypothetical protein